MHLFMLLGYLLRWHLLNHLRLLIYLWDHLILAVLITNLLLQNFQVILHVKNCLLFELSFTRLVQNLTLYDPQQRFANRK